MGPIGAGIAVLGAALGIGLIGYSALTGMARQPEAAAKLADQEQAERAAPAPKQVSLHCRGSPISRLL